MKSIFPALPGPTDEAREIWQYEELDELVSLVNRLACSAAEPIRVASEPTCATAEPNCIASGPA